MMKRIVTTTAFLASVIIVFLPNMVFGILDNLGVNTSSTDVGWIFAYYVLLPPILGLTIYLYFKKQFINGRRSLIILSIVVPLLLYLFLILYIIPQINIGPNL